MKIIVPKDLGGELRLFPACVVRATLEKVMLGQSRNKQPKATFRYTITEEGEGVKEGEPSAIGEAVLETYSLQEQSMWKINSVYKEVTGERIPQGDFNVEEFEAMLNEALTGTEWDLYVEPQIPQDGSSTEERTTVVKKELVR